MDSDPLFVVAIDFGTTYSGYAYCTKDDFKENPPKVHANTNWAAGGQGLLSQKTPTCLLLSPDQELLSFGYEAEDEYLSLAATNDHKNHYFFKRFKMKLHGIEDISEDSMITDELDKPLPAIEVFAKSISYLKQHFLDQLDALGIGFKDDEIRWILTVPAIWSDASKTFMRKAAVKAGIKSSQLRIALEPEAASIFSQHLKTERSGGNLSVSGPGTRYMVIDIGGGTADITVHEKLAGGNLKELYKASGGAWGGTAVDQQYILLLTRIVGGPVMHRFRTEATAEYLDMMREFEVTKRNIKPKGRTSVNIRLCAKLNEICEQENDETVASIVSSPNFPFKGKIRNVADKLILNVEIMQELFKKVTDHIIDHVQHLLQDKATKGVKLIILAGGFAESPIVQDAIRQAFQTEERKVIISQECGLSVLKGAVIFGYCPHEIKSRMLRCTYGIEAKVPFISGRHPESRREVVGGKDWCTGVFKMFVEVGTSMNEEDEITKEYIYYNEQKCKQLSVYVSSDPCPSYVDEACCRRLKTINLDPRLPVVSLEKRKIQVTYIFGKAEIEIEIRERETGFYYNDTFDYASKN